MTTRMPRARVSHCITRYGAIGALMSGLAGPASAATWWPPSGVLAASWFDLSEDDAVLQAGAEIALTAVAPQDLSPYGLDFYADNALAGNAPNYVAIYEAGGGIAANGRDWYLVVAVSHEDACGGNCADADEFSEVLDLMWNFARAPDPDPEAI